MSATGLPNEVSISVLVTAVSSITSCRSAAASPCASRRHCDRMLADRQRMRDVGLARLAELPAVGRVGELERALDERDVRRRQVIAEVSGELRDFRHPAPHRAAGLTRQLEP